MTFGALLAGWTQKCFSLLQVFGNVFANRALADQTPPKQQTMTARSGMFAETKQYFSCDCRLYFRELCELGLEALVPFETRGVVGPFR